MNQAAENEGIRVLEEHVRKAIPTTRKTNSTHAKPGRNEGMTVDDEDLAVDLSRPEDQRPQDSNG